jgi:hypothetical protein
VQKEFSLSRLALCALCVLSIFGLGACGQVGVPGQESALGQQQVLMNEHPNGLVLDWSNQHVVYPRVGPIQSLIALQHDPRAIQSWQAAARADWRRYNRFPQRMQHSSLHSDWSISLGLVGMAPAMFPAKFTFDTSAAVAVANCTTDFIVFPVNVAGSATQPNIVGLENLYSGTAGTIGICNRAPVASDDGISSTTLWSYNINAAGGKVATSPALSLDGTKVAFVETVAGTSAHFHVLAWANGDGKDAANRQNVLKPKTINSFSALAPIAGSGTATDLALGSTGDTLSSPFVDLLNDLAYVGNDAGVLFRVKNVFCTAITGCTPGVSATPSLDSTWGTGGALTIGGTCTGVLGKLTGPVVDGGTGNIFVGCADGKLYGFTHAGIAITGSPLTVGDATATGGIVDPPMVDPVNGFVYAESGSNGGSAVLFQAGTTSFTAPAPVKATLGAGAVINLHSPAFNDNYFTSVTSTTWVLYAGGLGAGNKNTLYGIAFGAGHAMTPGTPANADVFGFGPVEFSPFTSFLSAAAPAEDRLFESAISAFAGNLASFNIGDLVGHPPAGFPAGLEHFATEGSGTTGIVVDNASAQNQADSLYFGTLGGTNTAVKLTQSVLQ